MDRIDKYKRVEEDQQTGKGKAKFVPQERRDFRSDRFSSSNKPRRDYTEQSGSTGAQIVHAVFREPLREILEKIKHEPFFQWLNRMAGDPSKRNQNLYCAYHQEPGQVTDECRNLKNYLNRLVREGKLRHLLQRPEQSNVDTRQSALRPPIGTINVILAAPRRTGSGPFRVMSVGKFPTEPGEKGSKGARRRALPLIGFTEEDKEGTIQPHDDTLVVTLRIGVLRSADYTGRIAKWGTILSAFDIRYMPRTAIKGQVLADLVAEFAEPTLEGVEVSGSLSDDRRLVSTISLQEHDKWRAYIDGAANQKGSGVGLVLISPEGIILEKSLRLGFPATNNEAEYEALLEGMSMIRRLGGKCASIFSDSRLIVGQVGRELEAKDERMQRYLARAKRLRAHFDDFRLTHIPRSENTHADSLATLATSSAQPLPRVILVEDLCRPTEEEANGIRAHNVGEGPSWMDPLVRFLKYDSLPDDKVEADKIRRRAPRFWLSEDSKLYRRSFSGPYLLCVHPGATELILEELHEGICGSHTGGRKKAKPISIQDENTIE
ncbi:uncharacterized protein LOC126721926 [Quercus robur]|uniref:uncharacterized protein LOC126721926 n=1 Tax=Quercus robur TaxID=38942 RepID=UPI0021613343|nr:uncharacterized protein LOC126721926 [Quercus robur]